MNAKDSKMRAGVADTQNTGIFFFEYLNARSQMLFSFFSVRVRGQSSFYLASELLLFFVMKTKNLLKDLATFAFLVLAIGPCACEATESLETLFTGTSISKKQPISCFLLATFVSFPLSNYYFNLLLSKK